MLWQAIDPQLTAQNWWVDHEPIQSRWTGNHPLHYGYNRTLRLCEQHHCSSFYRKIKTNYYKASGQNEKCRSHHLRRFWTCRTILQIGSNSVSRFWPNLSRFLLDSCVVIGYNSPVIKTHLRRGLLSHDNEMITKPGIASRIGIIWIIRVTQDTRDHRN